MSSVINTNLDRRERPRAIINSHINYKLGDEEAKFNVAKMVDLSQTGVLIKLYEKLETETELTLQIKSDSVDEEPIEIIAKVVRIAKSSNDEQHSYGCCIVGIKNF